MTKAAQAFGRDLGNFMNAADTVAYAQAVYESQGGKSFSLKEYAKDNYRYSAEGVTATGLVVANRGRYGGTWAHPKLAVFFARWLDVKFSVWCDAVIEDILKGAAEVTITKPQVSAVVAMPVE